MRVFVTGAAGFLGSAIAQELAAAGHQVTAAVRPSRLQEGLTVPGCLMAAWDALQPPDALPPCDAVVHCATSNDILSRDFGAGIDLSVKGTYHLLQRAKAAGVTRFIFLSTIQVHGTELEGIITEDSPINCETPYALNHYLGEETCRMFAKSWPEAEIILLRPSNVYGVPSLPSVNRSTLVPMCFVKQALEEGKITLRSSGKQTRNFVSTQEVAQICQNLLTQPHKPSVRPVLAASAWNASILDVAMITNQLFKEFYNKEAKLEILSSEPEKGNDFLVKASLLSYTEKHESSIQKLKNCISNLIINPIFN
jgi:UDP-glucose 4-epimerase